MHVTALSVLIFLACLVSAQQVPAPCPGAPQALCPYSLAFTPALVTSGTDVTSSGRLVTSTNSTHLTMDFAPRLPGKYTFQFEARDLCQYSNQTVFVMARCPPRPIVVAIPSETRVPQGSSITISPTNSTVAPNFAGSLDFTWRSVSAPTTSGVWIPGSLFSAADIDTVGNLLIPASALPVDGRYVVSLTASDGCSAVTVYTCFDVVCNCGPSANAGATSTVWSNAQDARDNRPGEQFVLDGGGSYDFDLLYNPSTERLTYSWDFVSWTPAAPLPYPGVDQYPLIPADKEPWMWASNGTDVNATTSNVGYRTVYTPPSSSSTSIVKTWSFQQIPRVPRVTWVNTTTPGVETDTETTAQGTAQWYPLFNNGLAQGGEEWFQTDYLTAPPAGTPDDPTTTSIAAWVASTVLRAERRKPFSVVNSKVTTALDASVTYCQIQITQTPNPTPGPNTPATAANYWRATLTISGEFRYPESASPRPFSYQNCRGLWVFRLTVRDNCGAATASSDDFAVTVRCNRPPVSIVACNTTVVWQPTISRFPQVTVDGRSSYDNDNVFLTYHWQFADTLPPAFAAACVHRKCVQSYCNDPNLYTTYAYPSTPQTTPAIGSAGNVYGSGNTNRGFTHGTPNGACCSGSLCGPTVYPQFFRPTTPPAFGDTCRRWQTPPAAIPPLATGQKDCMYAAVAPTGFHVGNSAYFTPTTPGTYRVQLLVSDGCSASVGRVSVRAVCPGMSAAVELSADSGTYTGVPSSDPTVRLSPRLTLSDVPVGALTYAWAVANMAPASYNITSPFQANTNFKAFEAGTYILQLTVTDLCQTVSATATYNFLCPAKPSVPVLTVFMGATTTGTPSCTGSQCSVTVDLLSSGTQFPVVTVRAASTTAAAVAATYTWTLADAPAEYSVAETSVTANTFSFRPIPGRPTAGVYNVRYAVVASDGCSSSSGAVLRLTFSCVNTLTAVPQAEGGVSTIEYGFAGSSGSFPAVTYLASSSILPYGDTTVFQWKVTYNDPHLGVITVLDGPLHSGTGAVRNLTFVAPLPHTYQVQLSLTDLCKNSKASVSLVALCTSYPVPVVASPLQTVDWDSFKSYSQGGFPLVTITTASTRVPVEPPAVNTAPLLASWRPVLEGVGQVATADSLGVFASSANPQFTPVLPGVYSFMLSVTNGACKSQTEAVATVVTRCLDIVASVAPVAPVVWDGVRFPTVELDGRASTYTTRLNKPANLNALRYTWLFTRAPPLSLFVANRTDTVVQPEQQVPASLVYATTAAVPLPSGATMVNSTAAFALVETTTTTRWATTLFNHHYNRPVTCFKPDRAGTYAVLLTIDDACSLAPSRQQAVEVSVRCSPLPVVQVATVNGHLSVSLNGTRYRRVVLDARGTRPGTNATDTLTYSWVLVSRPTNITAQTPLRSALAVGSADITNAAGNYASIVPDVAGAYAIELRVSDGCNPAVVVPVIVTVTCQRVLQTVTPHVLVDGSAFLPSADTPQPSIDFPVSRVWSQVFTLRGIAVTNCQVFERAWRFIKRECADTFLPRQTPPPTPSPTPATTCAPRTRTCTWSVVEWPCAAGSAGDWQRPAECGGGSATTPCELVTTSPSVCSTTFTPRFPGVYKLRLVVADGCSAASSTVEVISRCDHSVKAVPGPAQTSLYLCTGQNWAFQPVKLDGSASFLTPQYVTPRPCPVSTPSPTPAPPPSRQQCCPEALLCPSCPSCPSCPACYRPPSTSAGAAATTDRVPALRRSYLMRDNHEDGNSNTNHYYYYYDPNDDDDDDTAGSGGGGGDGEASSLFAGPTASFDVALMLGVAVPLSVLAVLSAAANVAQFRDGGRRVCAAEAEG